MRGGGGGGGLFVKNKKISFHVFFTFFAISTLIGNKFVSEKSSSQH